MQHNEIDFLQGCIEKQNINLLETIPYYVPRNAYIENFEEGINLYPSQYAPYVSLYSYFSNLLIADKIKVSIKGSFPINLKIACTSFNMEFQQIETVYLQTQKDEETYIFNFEKKDIFAIFLFTFQNEGEPFIIKKISYSPSAYHGKCHLYKYSFKQTENVEYIEHVDAENITWRLLVPVNNKNMWFSHNIEEYVKKICHIN